MHFFPRSHSRFFARARSEYPCVFFIPGFIAGQLLSYWWGWGAVTGYLAWCALRKSLGAPLRGMFMLAFACGYIPGVVSMLGSLGPDVDPELNGESSWVAQITGDMRHRRPGGVEFASLLVRAAGRPGAPAPLFERPIKVLCRGPHLPWRNTAFLEAGSVVVIRASFERIRPAPGLFSWDGSMYRRGYRAICRLKFISRPLQRNEPWVFRWRKRLVGQVRRVLGDSEDAGFLLASSLGTRDVISERTEEAFKRSGLSHLLVLSGYQVTLVYYTIYRVISWLVLRSWRLCVLLPARRTASILALICSLVFVFFSGLEGSSVRAGLALVFVVIGASIERGGGLAGSISFSFLLLSWLWPGAYLEPGVQLTFAALFGVWLGSSFSGNFVLQYLYACFCISLCTSIVTTGWFNTFSPAGFVLNPVFAPIVSIIGCQGGLAALAALVAGLDRDGLALKAVAWLLAEVKGVVADLSKPPWVSVNLGPYSKLPVIVFLCAAAGYLFLRKIRTYRRRFSL